MNRRAKVLLGLGLLAAAPACFAQYTMDLTGVGNGTVADGVYVSPYQGTVAGQRPQLLRVLDLRRLQHGVLSEHALERHHDGGRGAQRQRKIHLLRDVRRQHLHRAASLQCGRMARERPARQSGQYDDAGRITLSRSGTSSTARPRTRPAARPGWKRRPSRRQRAAMSRATSACSPPTAPAPIPRTRARNS